MSTAAVRKILERVMQRILRHQVDEGLPKVGHCTESKGATVLLLVTPHEHNYDSLHSSHQITFTIGKNKRFGISELTKAALEYAEHALEYRAAECSTHTCAWLGRKPPPVHGAAVICRGLYGEGIQHKVDIVISVAGLNEKHNGDVRLNEGLALVFARSANLNVPINDNPHVLKITEVMPVSADSHA